MTDPVRHPRGSERYDRRGRSASDDRSTGFEVQNEIDDLAAVIEHVGVGGRAALFGHSSGAILALEAASRGLPVDRVAVYEPPLRVEVDTPYPPAEAFDELTDLVSAGDRDGAATFFLSRILFVPEEGVAMMRSDPSWAFLVGHASTLPYDVLLSRPWELVDRQPLAALDLPVLAMYGDRTSSALEAGARVVAQAVPGAELLAIPGEDHGVLQHPETIEPALAKFFAGR